MNREKELASDKDKLEEMNEELEDVKERLMIERRMVFEESEKSNFN